TDVWAVGYYLAPGGRSRNLTLHWDGVEWHVVPVPDASPGSNQLFGVTAVAPNDVWAVGTYSPEQYRWQTLILHWDGGAWVVVPHPDESQYNTVLRGVSAVTSNDVWAVGYSLEGQYADEVILHWD